MSRFGLLLALSFGVAAVGFWIGPGRFLAYAGPNDVPDAWLISICIYVAWAWIALIFVLLARFKWRALWALIGAPAVLFWPYMWVVYAGACHPWGCH